MEKDIYPNRIRVILAERCLTNRWLAEQMGVTEITVSRSGKMVFTSSFNSVRLANLLLYLNY